MSREVYGLAGAELRVVDGNLQLTFGVAPAAMRALTAQLWRATPPTVDEVKVYAWWWNKPANGAPPHVIKLSVEGCRRDVDGDIVDLGFLDPATDGVIAVIVEDQGDGEFHIFNPDGWPGAWAPAVPP